MLIQQNHGCWTKADGQISTVVSGYGADIHVIKDDGTNFRDLPWGRDGKEFCQGHQCWRGNNYSAVTSTVTYEIDNKVKHQLIESSPKKPKQCTHYHMGRRLNEERNELSKYMSKPEFIHFAFDSLGEYIIADCKMTGLTHSKEINRENGYIVFGKYINSNSNTKEPYVEFHKIIRPKSSWEKLAHPHPFFSPDRKRAFFNSDFNGKLQI